MQWPFRMSQKIILTLNDYSDISKWLETLWKSVLTRTSSGLPKAPFFCVIRYRSLSHKKPSLLAIADVGVRNTKLKSKEKSTKQLEWCQEARLYKPCDLKKIFIAWKSNKKNLLVGERVTILTLCWSGVTWDWKRLNTKDYSQFYFRSWFLGF